MTRFLDAAFDLGWRWALVRRCWYRLHGYGWRDLAVLPEEEA